MNMNIKNLKSSISTQDTSVKSKKVHQENSKTSFQKSLDDSQKVINNKKDELNSKKCETNDEVNKINDNDKVDSENIDKLKELIELIDLISKENINEHNTYKLNNKLNDSSFENINIEENFKDNNENKGINLKKLFKDLNNYFNKKDSNLDDSEKNISKMIMLNEAFINNTFDNNINLENINNNELIQNILKDNDSLKFLIKDFVSDFQDSDSEFINNIDNIFENGKFLTSDELLKNIKNEISQKINKVNDNNLELDKNTITNYGNTEEIKNLNSISEVKNNFDKSENILKEISGNVKEIDKNFENFLINNMRSNDLNNNIPVFNKVVDTTIQTKFVKEFIESINYMNTNNKSEMIVKLNPEHLGKMDIKYEVVKDNVRLSITVEKMESLKIINNVVSDIKNMIKENHQINLDNIQVNLQEFGFSSDGQGKDYNQNKNNNFEDNKTVQANNLKIEDEENSYNTEKKNLRNGILV